jgi:hypothetical protein
VLHDWYKIQTRRGGKHELESGFHGVTGYSVFGRTKKQELALSNLGSRKREIMVETVKHDVGAADVSSMMTVHQPIC